MELIGLNKSNRKNKKYYAIFENPDGTHKNVHFGDSRYSDYTIHKNLNRKINYEKRHHKEINNPPDTPGALSLNILWGPYPDIMKNLKHYVEKYNL